jgi:hypothetical protein
LSPIRERRTKIDWRGTRSSDSLKTGAENIMVQARPPGVERAEHFSDSLAGIREEHQTQPVDRGIKTGLSEREAFSRLACLPRVRPEKPFSGVSSPILAWSDFTLTAGEAVI